MAIARNLPILAKKDKQDQVATRPFTLDKVFQKSGSTSFLVWFYYKFYLIEQMSCSDWQYQSGLLDYNSKKYNVKMRNT